MQRTIILVCFLIGFVSIHSHAQDGDDTSELRVGDRMPEYKFVNLINYKAPIASTSDFKGKLLILYFWSTNCLSCIESWPKLLQLQDKFRDSVQFILFNSHQDEKAVRSIYEKRRKLAGVNVTIPTVCGDTVLSNRFPRMGVPHVVWIDANGYVRAKTYGTLVTASNIERFLKDPLTSLPNADLAEPSVTINYKAPLFVNGNAGSGEGIIQYSVLSRFVENVRNGTAALRGNAKTGKYSRLIAVNMSLQDLYAFAFSNRLSSYGTLWELPHSRMIFEGIDSSDYVASMPRDGILIKKNIYTYNLITDSVSMQDVQRVMQGDLARHFGYIARWEKRRVKCRVLAMDDPDKFRKPSGRKYYQTIDHTTFSVDGGITMNRVMWLLEGLYFESPIPILNETNFAGSPAGIQLEVDSSNPDALDRALRQIGMSFKEEYRVIDMVVISKPDRTTTTTPAYAPEYK
jgi:thiol-disulfide isomerase/thioredoxin